MVFYWTNNRNNKWKSTKKPKMMWRKCRTEWSQVDLAVSFIRDRPL